MARVPFEKLPLTTQASIQALDLATARAQHEIVDVISLWIDARVQLAQSAPTEKLNKYLAPTTLQTLNGTYQIFKKYDRNERIYIRIMAAWSVTVPELVEVLGQDAISSTSYLELLEPLSLVLSFDEAIPKILHNATERRNRSLEDKRPGVNRKPWAPSDISQVIELYRNQYQQTVCNTWGRDISEIERAFGQDAMKSLLFASKLKETADVCASFEQASSLYQAAKIESNQSDPSKRRNKSWSVHYLDAVCSTAQEEPASKRGVPTPPVAMEEEPAPASAPSTPNSISRRDPTVAVSMSTPMIHTNTPEVSTPTRAITKKLGLPENRVEVFKDNSNGQEFHTADTKVGANALGQLDLKTAGSSWRLERLIARQKSQNALNLLKRKQDANGADPTVSFKKQKVVSEVCLKNGFLNQLTRYEASPEIGRHAPSVKREISEDLFDLSGSPKSDNGNDHFTDNQNCTIGDDDFEFGPYNDDFEDSKSAGSVNDSGDLDSDLDEEDKIEIAKACSSLQYASLQGAAFTDDRSLLQNQSFERESDLKEMRGQSEDAQAPEHALSSLSNQAPPAVIQHAAHTDSSGLPNYTTLIVREPANPPEVTAAERIDLSEGDDPVAPPPVETQFENYLQYRKGLAAGQKLNDNAILTLLKICQVSDILVLSSPPNGPGTLVWGKRSQKLVRNGRNKIVVPLHHANTDHWTVVWFDVKAKTIYHIDSWAPSQATTLYQEALLTFAGKILPGDDGQWAYVVRPCQQQKNGFDCGVMVVVYSWCWMLKVDVPSDICCKTWRQLFRDLCDVKAQQFMSTVPYSDARWAEYTLYATEHSKAAPASLPKAFLPECQSLTRTFNDALQELNRQIATANIQQQNHRAAQKVILRAKDQFSEELALLRHNFSDLSSKIVTIAQDRPVLEKLNLFVKDALLSTFDAKIAQISTEADKLRTCIHELPVELLAYLSGSVELRIRFQSTWSEATVDLMRDTRAALRKHDEEAEVQGQLRRVALGELERGFDSMGKEGKIEEH